MLFGFAHAGKALANGGLDTGRIINAERGLRDHGQLGSLAGLHGGDIGFVFHQMNAAGHLPHRAFDFGMTFVADHEELIALFGQLGDFHVHLGDQRASGVKDGKTSIFGLFLHRFADTVGREHQRGAWRHVIEFFNEDRAFGLEVVDHKGVVHDFMAYINRRAKLEQGPFHDFDGPVHARTKTTGLGQQDFLWSNHIQSSMRCAAAAKTSTTLALGRCARATLPQL